MACPHVLMRQLPYTGDVMLELARTIAYMIQQIDKDAKTSVERVQRSNAVVKVQGEDPIRVEWIRAGARINGKEFYHENGDFNLDDISAYIGRVMVARAEVKARRKKVEDDRTHYQPVRDAVKNDPRISVNHASYDEERPFHITFKAKTITAMQMAADFLLDFGDSDDPPQPKPTLATAKYLYRGDRYSLRGLAQIDSLTEHVWEQILAMPCYTHIDDGNGFTIFREE